MTLPLNDEITLLMAQQDGPEALSAARRKIALRDTEVALAAIPRIREALCKYCETLDEEDKPGTARRLWEHDRDWQAVDLANELAECGATILDAARPVLERKACQLRDGGGCSS